ncbi:MAG: response regulator [Phototrophicaceae bacterium]
MIAEDETDIRNLVAIMAEHWGHVPLTFKDGTEAWKFLDKLERGEIRDNIPDFALMDIRMPGYRGDEIAHRMRTIAILQNIPIVLMTAYSLSDGERAAMLTNGADLIIDKPLPDFAKLESDLNNVIRNKNR